MRALLILSLVLCLLAPAAAMASGDAVLADCADNGKINGSYTQGDYQSALKNIPADADEYTDCREVIQNAQRAGSKNQNLNTGGDGGSGTGGSSGGSGAGDGGGSASSDGDAFDVVPGSPEEAAALAEAADAGSAPVKLAGTSVTPGAAGLSASDLSRSLPTPLLVLLVLLGLGALAAAGFGLRDQWPAVKDGPRSLIDRVRRRGDG